MRRHPIFANTRRSASSVELALAVGCGCTVVSMSSRDHRQRSARRAGVTHVFASLLRLVHHEPVHRAVRVNVTVGMSPRALMATAQVIDAPGASNDQYSQNWRYSETLTCVDRIKAHLARMDPRARLTHAPDASRRPTGTPEGNWRNRLNVNSHASVAIVACETRRLGMVRL